MFLSCLTASFKNFFFFASIIIIHEMGHLLMGLFFKWKVDKIYLYPYGGVTKFNEDINKSLKEELLILLNGPFFQIIYLLIGHFLFHDKNFENYNLTILIFNLLPIFPLDGGRILNLFFNYFLPFRTSYDLSMITSFLVSFLMVLYSIINRCTFNIVLMFLIVISKVVEELKKRRYYFQKFLLERYMNEYFNVKMKIITSIKKMMRDRRHIIKERDIYYTEKDYLRHLYNRK